MSQLELHAGQQKEQEQVRRENAGSYNTSGDDRPDRVFGNFGKPSLLAHAWTIWCE